MERSMKRANLERIAALALGSICAGINLNRVAFGQGSDALVMVSNKSNAAAANMSKGEAKKLLLGQTQSWAGGVPVIVVLTPAGSAEHTAVLTKICGMTEAEFVRYQLQVAFTGRTPATLHEEHSVAGVTTFVKTHPGAVGFLRKGEVTDDLRSVLNLE